MNEQEQRIAIAKACPNVAAIDKDNGGVFWKHPDPYVLFDPVHDLNAMHEAESTLIDSGFICEFSSCLRFIVQRVWFAAGRRMPGFSDLDWQFSISHATAAQRAEAFLRTIGEWKEGA